MKTLYIMRHAKAEPHHNAPSDFQRRLTDRGFEDAVEMGKKLKRRETPLQQIVSSPAIRTLLTASTVASTLSFPEEQIIYKASIYEANYETIASIVCELDEDYDHIMLIGHNPTFTYMMQYYTIDKIDNLPTSGIYAIEFNSSDWKNVKKQTGKLLWTDWPGL